MNTQDSCIFCKIVVGEIPATIIYEDEQTIAFLDIAPIRKGHSLIVPKCHCADIHTFPLSHSVAVMNTIQIVSKAFFQGIGATGCTIVQNNGASSGQVVFHIHWHCIPRYDNDGLLQWDNIIESEDTQETASQIKEAIRQGEL